METSVIITLIICTFLGWNGWLIYNYSIFTYKTKIESDSKYFIDRYKSVRECLIDLVNAINNKFPKSNLKYERTDNGDTVSGEIKY